MGLIFGGIKECKGMYGNFEGSNPYSPLFGLVIYIYIYNEPCKRATAKWHQTTNKRGMDFDVCFVFVVNDWILNGHWRTNKGGKWKVFDKRKRRHQEQPKIHGCVWICWRCFFFKPWTLVNRHVLFTFSNHLKQNPSMCLEHMFTGGFAWEGGGCVHWLMKVHWIGWLDGRVCGMIGYWTDDFMVVMMMTMMMMMMMMMRMMRND